MNPEYKFEKLFKFPKCSQEVCDSFVLFVFSFSSNPHDAEESSYDKFIYLQERKLGLKRFFRQNLLTMLVLVLFSQTLALWDCSRARVWSKYYSSIVISSWSLLKFWYCFSLAERRKQYTIGGKEVWSSYRSWYGKAIIKFQTEKPSVMHTKHDCTGTKSQGPESRENKLHGSRHICQRPLLVTKIK